MSTIAIHNETDQILVPQGEKQLKSKLELTWMLEEGFKERKIQIEIIYIRRIQKQRYFYNLDLTPALRNSASPSHFTDPWKKLRIDSKPLTLSALSPNPFTSSLSILLTPFLVTGSLSLNPHPHFSLPFFSFLLPSSLLSP